MLKIHPSDITKGKYWLHLALLTIIVEVLFLISSLWFKSQLGFEMPPFTAKLVIDTIFSAMTFILFGVLAVADILTHTILKYD